MSTIAAIELSRTSDLQFVGIVLLISYGLLFPAYILFARYRQSRRVRKQLVTSKYKRPLKLAPAEVSYMFSAKVKRCHLHATLLDLNNRGVVTITEKHGTAYVDMGPRVAEKLKLFEKLLVLQVHNSDNAVPVSQVLEGFTNFRTKDGQTIRGSRQYVFWWLLRQGLRDQKVIDTKMVPKYVKMLVVYGAAASFFISTVPVVSVRLIQMIDNGEIVFSDLFMTFMHGLQMWAASLLIILIATFFLLRFKGWMLGRIWLLTPKVVHNISQLESYREFVKMAHSGKLHYESASLKKAAISETRPFAVALGYVKQK